MECVKLLIDKASKVCGSDSALADRLGIARQNISLMRAGKRSISPATAAELADIAGEDARQAAIDAVIESAKGTRRESVLREILGKAKAAGGAAMCHISYNDEQICDTDLVTKPMKPINRLYIVSIRFYKRLRTMLEQIRHRTSYA